MPSCHDLIFTKTVVLKSDIWYVGPHGKGSYANGNGSNGRYRYGPEINTKKTGVIMEGQILLN